MFNWLFKKVVNLREKVAVDLGKQDEEKPFLDHLEDLRTMIVRLVITLLVVTLAAFIFYQELLAIIERPLVLAGIRDKISLQNLKPIGGFMTAMNVSIVAGIIMAFPLLLFFILQFVLPGLRSNEKKIIFPAIAVGGGLFMMGVLFAYFVVAPRALLFFYEFSVEMDQLSTAEGGALPPDKLLWERVEYVKFVCQFILIFGACFELPVVVMALVKLDVLNYKVMKTSRSWAMIIICVVAAIITPTQDAMTLGLLAVPMYLLYEICIWLAWGMEQRDRKLYPEFYKERDEDEKALELEAGEEDWDNENYNPWGGDDNDDDEDDSDSGSGSKPKPKPSAPAPSSTAASPDPSTSAAPAPVKSPNSPANTVPMNDDFYTQPSPETLPPSASPEPPVTPQPSDAADDTDDDDPQRDVEKRNQD